MNTFCNNSKLYHLSRNEGLPTLLRVPVHLFCWIFYWEFHLGFVSLVTKESRKNIQRQSQSKTEIKQIKSRRIPSPSRFSCSLLFICEEQRAHRAAALSASPVEEASPSFLSPPPCVCHRRSSDRLLRLRMPSPVALRHSVVRTASRVAQEQWSGPTRSAGACLYTRLYARHASRQQHETTGEACPPPSRAQPRLHLHSLSSCIKRHISLVLLESFAAVIDLLTLYLSTKQDYLLLIWQPVDEHMAHQFLGRHTITSFTCGGDDDGGGNN